MSILICMLSKDRYPHLKLCSEWLLKRMPPDSKLVVFDDGSTDKRVHNHLRSLARRGADIYLGVDQQGLDPAQRCGVQRRRAVNLFLASTEQYLLLLDDDILVGAGAIEEAISDWRMLRAEGFRPGSLTLHGEMTQHDPQKIGDMTFAELRLSGEANWLFCRETLTENWFGFGPKEFADVQQQKMREQGLKYYGRIQPSYQVQHIGIGMHGSVIHRDRAVRPFWCDRPYTHTYGPSKGQMVQVGGFDLDFYLEACRVSAPEEVPLTYLRVKGV